MQPCSRGLFYGNAPLKYFDISVTCEVVTVGLMPELHGNVTLKLVVLSGHYSTGASRDLWVGRCMGGHYGNAQGVLCTATALSK